ncbi:hypothetical protein [Afipia sp. P52-10]|uniref:hypothetical protein n=1 Tax=Afipia sp. P52-10 TaxID=1429916 RepID=UPI0012689C5B|nr:hypothetical protein [Afipia sp. P52-10]
MTAPPASPGAPSKDTLHPLQVDNRSSRVLNGLKLSQHCHMACWLNDSNGVAAIVNALRRVYNDDIARVMLTEGATLATIIDALLNLSTDHRLLSKLVTMSLYSGDFVVTPNLNGPSHLRYVYDRPNSLAFTDIIVLQPHRTLASTDIRLQLRQAP